MVNVANAIEYGEGTPYGKTIIMLIFGNYILHTSIL